MTKEPTVWVRGNEEEWWPVRLITNGDYEWGMPMEVPVSLWERYKAARQEGKVVQKLLSPFFDSYDEWFWEEVES